MRNRSRTVGFVLALAVLTSCSPTAPEPPAPTPPSVVNITCNAGGEGNVINCGTSNGNGGTPSPAPGKQIVFGEKVSENGETCPSPLVPAEGPAIQRQTRVGCTSAVTCSPTDKDGNVIKDTSTNTYVELVKFEQLGSAAAGRFSQDDNAYNGSVFCSAPGSVTLSCSLRDTATGKVTSGGDGGTSPVAWTMTCVQ